MKNLRKNIRLALAYLVIALGCCLLLVGFISAVASLLAPVQSGVALILVGVLVITAGTMLEQLVTLNQNLGHLASTGRYLARKEQREVNFSDDGAFTASGPGMRHDLS